MDSCVDPDGAVSPWAAAILAAAPTYAETSPSGTGIKAFFYIVAEHVRPFLDAIGVPPEGWGARRSIGDGGADHGPAVEFYAARRYFAVTDDLWPGYPDRVALLGWPALERIAALIPRPRSSSTSKRGGDSRSAIAFRKGAEARRAGKSFEEMAAALRADPETADWVREKGEAGGG